ncbi:hypothetical protein PMAYCL1PPCAC_17332, partial [Pristionchus mayeri]
LSRMQFSSVLFTSLLLLISVQAKPWGVFSSDETPFDFGDFFENLGKEIVVSFGVGPSYLRDVSRQARQDYYKIFQNKTLTRAQLTSAVGSWANTNNITEKVDAFNEKKNTETAQFRANVTSAVQKLPDLISKINAIEDNKNLTPIEADKQTGQLIRNATAPFLRDLIFDVLPPSGVASGLKGVFHDSNEKKSAESSEDYSIF